MSDRVYRLTADTSELDRVMDRLLAAVKTRDRAVQVRRALFCGGDSLAPGLIESVTRPAAGAGRTTIALKPSKSFLEFVTALAAGDFDRGGADGIGHRGLRENG